MGANTGRREWVKQLGTPLRNQELLGLSPLKVAIADGHLEICEVLARVHTASEEQSCRN